MIPIIQLVNRTRRVRDARFVAALPALQTQISRDFVARWGLGAELEFVGKQQMPDPKKWLLWLMDNSDDPGALGYHEADMGVPEGKVFIEEDLRYGAEITVTMSHELLEMLADPFITSITPLVGARRYAIEVCDPVEADSDGYTINGVRVSNFVCPAYFALPNVDHTQDFDHLKLLRSPCPAMRPGGYILYQENGTWHTNAARFGDGTLSARATRFDGRSTQKARKIK